MADLLSALGFAVPATKAGGMPPVAGGRKGRLAPPLDCGHLARAFAFALGAASSAAARSAFAARTENSSAKRSTL